MPASFFFNYSHPYILAPGFFQLNQGLIDSTWLANEFHLFLSLYLWVYKCMSPYRYFYTGLRDPNSRPHTHTHTHSRYLSNQVPAPPCLGVLYCIIPQQPWLYSDGLTSHTLCMRFMYVCSYIWAGYAQESTCLCMYIRMQWLWVLLRSGWDGAHLAMWGLGYNHQMA